jgi:hypothetical protein
MTDANETEQVTKIFLYLGAEPKLALQMAKQLLKRAEQRSNEEEVSKTEALKELLEVAVYGAQGMLKPGDDAQSQQKKP